ncbi:hypothetical protein FACS189467_5660 [Bacteroidia bacterium]|nr:hypothetical protein FACS189467_5660 [Bacteroidia bacterium]
MEENGKLFAQRFRKLMQDFWAWLGEKLNIRQLSPEQISNLTFEQAVNGALADITSGKRVENIEKNATFADNLTIEQMLEGTTPIETPKHGFKNIKEARDWAKENIVGTYKNADTGEDMRISNLAVGKYLSEKAIKKSVSLDAHLSALKQMPNLIKTALLKESNPDKNNSVNIKEIRRLYGAINYESNVYSVKITVKVVKNEDNKAYSYEVMDIENPDASNRVSLESRRHFDAISTETNNPDLTSTTEIHLTAESRQSVAERQSTNLSTNKGTTNNLNNQTFNEKNNDLRLQVAPNNNSVPQRTDFKTMPEYVNALAAYRANQADETSTHISALKRDNVLSRAAAINKALNTQKSDIQQGISTVINFANDLIGGKTFDELTQANVSQILTQVRNAATAKDITDNLNKIVDIVLDKQVKVAKKLLGKFLDIKIEGKNQVGVRVAKTVDIVAFPFGYNEPKNGSSSRLTRRSACALW